MSLYQGELAVLKRQHVTRSLSFTANTFERSGSHVDAGSEDMNGDERSSLQDNQVSSVH